MGSIHYRKSDNVAVIRFVNPPLGLLNMQMTNELETLLREISADPEVRVLILTGGQADVFIRHFDLKELSEMAEGLYEATPDLTVEWSSSPFHRITRCLETMSQPVIAASNGICMGVGYELALACDIRLASHGEYSNGLPKMNIAMLPGGGGTVRLARLVGTDLAMELICTASTLSPQQSDELGLVSRIVPDAYVAAQELATQIARRPNSGVAATKHIVHASVNRDLESALTLEQRAVNARLGTAEVGAALRRVAELGLDIRGE